MDREGGGASPTRNRTFSQITDTFRGGGCRGGGGGGVKVSLNAFTLIFKQRISKHTILPRQMEMGSHTASILIIPGTQMVDLKSEFLS